MPRILSSNTLQTMKDDQRDTEPPWEGYEQGSTKLGSKLYVSDSTEQHV